VLHCTHLCIEFELPNPGGAYQIIHYHLRLSGIGKPERERERERERLQRAGKQDRSILSLARAARKLSEWPHLITEPDSRKRILRPTCMSVLCATLYSSSSNAREYFKFRMEVKWALSSTSHVIYNSAGGCQLGIFKLATSSRAVTT